MKSVMQFFKNHPFLGYLVLIILSLFIGWAVRGCVGGENKRISSEDRQSKDYLGENVEIWTCSMHPQIRLPNPGKCPICGMDLVPAETGKNNDLNNRIQLSESAMKLAEIETVPVTRKNATVTIRLTGKVTYDETLIRFITSRVSGRIDKMFIDFPGTKVNKGEKLILLYSPDLLSAQKELLGAFSLMKSMEKEKNSGSYQSAVMTYESSRKKLLLLGITKQQIDHLLDGIDISEHLIIHSPVDGIVLEKNRLEGEYVDAGTEIYKVADLSRVWVIIDAYESDIALLKEGLEVRFTTESYPGIRFTGKVVFINPVLDEKTRTVGVRVNVPNPDGRLKPGMFVRSDIDMVVSGEEKKSVLVDVYKWVCPMHLEIVRLSPGDCPVCGMTLEKKKMASSTETKISSRPHLLIPVSAALITGKRAVVYVKIEDGVFEGREVELGLRAGDYYIVKSGLREGEEVVVKGNFKIDSAMQIEAKRSMMNEDKKEPAGHRH